MAFSIEISFKLTDADGAAVTGKDASAFAASTLWQGGLNITNVNNTIVVTELALGHYQALVTVATALDTQVIISSNTDDDLVDGSIRSNCFTIPAKQLQVLDDLTITGGDVHATLDGETVALTAGHGLATSAELVTLTIGTGTYACSLIIQTAGGSPIEGVNCKVTSEDGSVVYGHRATDAAGQITFNAPATTVRIYPYSPDWLFDDTYYSRTITGGGALTAIEGQAAASSAPADPDKCALDLYLKKPDGAITDATVTLQYVAPPEGVGSASTDRQAFIGGKKEAEAEHVAGGKYSVEVWQGGTVRVRVAEPGEEEWSFLLVIPEYARGRVDYESTDDHRKPMVTEVI